MKRNEIYLIEMIKENHAHARHIEMERLTFLSLSMVSASALYALGLGGDSPVFSLSLLIAVSALLGINIVGFCLLARWDSVYKGHMNKAEELQQLYKAACGENEFTLDSQIPGNQFYYYNNKQKIGGETMEEVIEKKGYISTATCFYIFNGFISVVLFVCFLSALGLL